MQKSCQAGEVLNRCAPSQAMIQELARSKKVTTHQLASFILAEMADIANDSVAPQKANSQIRHAMALLKTAEVEFKWKTSDGAKGKELMLASGD